MFPFNVLFQPSIVSVHPVEPIILLHRNSTVVETSFATLKLDSPPLISIYYLPYKNGELKKIVFYSGHYNFSK